MKKLPASSWQLYVLLLFVNYNVLVAEGTKEMSPTPADEAMLNTNNPSFGNFMMFDGPEVSRLLVRINDFNSEILYIGLSAEADDNGILPTTPASAGSYSFRIVAPDGTVCHGPFTINVGNSNCPTWTLASTGPAPLFPGGYSTGQPYATFNPATAPGAMQNGDYRIEILDIPPPSVVNIKWFDFTVAKNGAPVPGRLWSLNWVLRTPQIAVVPPECGWDRPFNGVFYSYTPEGFVSKLNFLNSGFKGLTFIVAFGDSGPGNTGNVEEDRKSINMGTAQQIGEAADYKAFINEPDPLIFSTPPNLCGEINYLGVTCDTGGYCIKTGITKPGLVEVILDFFGNNGMFDPGTTDVLLVQSSAEPDTFCLYWDGLKGDGTPLSFNETVNAYVRYSQGIQHYSAYDVEFLYNGFCTQTIRPVCNGMSNLLYWDDSNIVDNPATPFVDEGDPGTGQPLLQLNGCICQVNSCRTWDNYQLGSNPSQCIGEPAGYGNERILNTWWYAVSTTLGPISLPILRAEIVGDSLICTGEFSSFMVNTNPAMGPYTYSWSGPGGFMANTANTGPINLPGTYTVTVTDQVTMCEAIESAELMVSPAIITDITYLCIMNNAPNANIDLTVTGGVPPFTYLWSTGATTQDLMNVPPGTYTVTVTDANGCTATDMITTAVCCSLDIDCPPMNGGTFACITEVPPPDNNLITINDYCGMVTITSNTISNTASGCGTDTIFLTRTYSISDANGNSQSCVQVFKVIDNTVPVIQCPPNITVQCTASTLPPNTGNATASDNCTGMPIVTFSDFVAPGNCPQEMTITRTWLATDNCGNSSTCNQIIFVDDSTPPVLVCPPNITVECNASTAPANTGNATATDNCQMNPTITFTDVITGSPCPEQYTITRTWLAMDACGNSSTCNQSILVRDNSAPMINCPPNITVQCNTSTAPAATGNATASDNCDGTPTITFSDVVTGAGCPEQMTITRTWTAADDCGNSASCVQIIFVQDNTPPAVTCPPNVTIQCSENSTPVGTGMATATDNCDPTPTITSSDQLSAGSCAQGAVILRTWVATDDCGNASSCSQVIVINDQIPPTITCPPNITVQCNTSTAPAATGNPTASDNCDATLEISFTDVLTPGNCPQEFTIARTWRAMDDCGNSSSCTQTIFVDDSNPPVLNCPPNITILCTQSTSPEITGFATGSDNCDGNPLITFTDVIVPGSCPQERTITRTWHATDACGNMATCNQIIFVDDNQAPLITCPPSITIACTASTLPASTGSAIATDNCDGMPVISFTDAISPGMCPQEMTITRTWRATDACGNSSNCVQTIFVDDNLAPTINCPANITIQCQQSTLPATTGMATATDNCDGTPTITFTDVVVPGNCPQAMSITRTWIAADDCGNSNSCVQLISVIDTQAPSVTAPPNVTISCADSTDPDETGDNLIITDNCSTTFDISYMDNTSGTIGCNGTGPIVRTWIVADQCGNVTTMNQVITLIDTTPPVAICQDITLDFDESSIVSISPDTADGGSFDNCGNVTFNLFQTQFDCIQFRDEPVQPNILTVTDQCGNSSTCEFNITGVGGQGIIMNCPEDVTIHLDPGQCDIYYTYTISAVRRCGTEDPVLVQIDNSGYTSGDLFPVGTYDQKWVAYNSLGDTVYCSFSITIVGYVQTNNTIACNDLVQISLTEDCEARINADMILEGEHYSCYNDFFIQISNGVSGNYSVLVDETNIEIGQTYIVTITDNKTGYKCWGQVLIEDKFPPIVGCVTDSIYCNTPTTPVFAPPGNGHLPYAPPAHDACSDLLNYHYTDDRFETVCGLDSIIRHWQISDPSGNTTLCDQRIIVIPTTVNDIVFPNHYQGECFGSADPDVTGRPTLGGYPLGDDTPSCNLTVWYVDKVLNDCGGAEKIARKWNAYDGCTQEHLTFTQVIKLSDLQPPQIVCPDNMEVGTDFWYCYANISVPKPQVEDACSQIASLELTSPDGTVVTYGSNYVINELAVGIHPVTWTAYDECGNSASCTFYITVVDDVPPVANCDAHTIIALTNDGPKGITLIPAEVFDDGSYDNCGPVTFRARRMDSCIDFDWTTEGACIDDIPGGVPPVNSRDKGTVHRPCVPFACCDIGAGPIMVELEVTDQYGNVNYCMVEAEVQDKISPTIECPPDIIVSCDYWFNAQEGTFQDAAGNNNGSLDEDPLSAIFGNVFDAYYHDQSERRPLLINDPGNLDFAQPYLWGIDGWATDNCNVDLQVRVRIVSDCSGGDLPANAPEGAVKLIERRFTASDGNTGVAPGTCTQRIWVVDYKPFYITDVNCNNANPNDGVIWPCDIALHTCPSGEFTPQALGSEPTLYDDNCSLVASTYEDDYFTFQDSACVKILRHWTVIDWCQFDANSGAGKWEYLQVIKVIDTQKPEFLDCPDTPPVYCVDDPNVSLPDNNQVFLGHNNPLSTSCSAHIRLEHVVREMCSSHVTYDVKVYPFNGQDYIQVVNETELTLVNDTARLVFDTRTCPIQDLRLNGLPYNSAYCDEGYYHRILWNVRDGCGNNETCEYLFRLEDCKKPSPVCINGLSTVVMPASGTITVWAKDFNASSFDDCTPDEDLDFSFSGLSYQPSKTITCDSILQNGGPLFQVQIWAADNGNDHNCNHNIEWSERNKDYCTTTLLVTDNLNLCDGDSAGLSGIIHTEDLISVGNVNVVLKNMDGSESHYETAEDGQYFFMSLPSGVDYVISASRDDDPKNGVSTIDLIDIQRHLLGIEQLDSPYKLIAADANNSGTVSAIDLFEIRKLILGATTKFPNNTSWRFVPADYTFIDPYFPWPFQEIIEYHHLSGMYGDNDFIGVKIGDVNHSAVAHAQKILPRGDRPVVSLLIHDQITTPGQVIRVPVMVDSSALLGMQFTLETGSFEVERVEAGSLSVTVDHYALHHGGLTFSWNDAEAHNIGRGENAFYLVLKAKGAATLSSQLRLTSGITAAEAYIQGSQGLTETDMRLLWPESAAIPTSDEDAFVLYQNVPNPWTESTSIGYSLPDDLHVELTIFDVNGKALLRHEMEGHAGYNEFILSAKDLSGQGVMYYKIDAYYGPGTSAVHPDFQYSATKKMVNLN